MSRTDDRRSPPARYDGFAQWYDEALAIPFGARSGEAAARLLGRGRGRCLDLCCGTGIHFDLLSALGWQVTGVDLSADQLRIANDRAAGHQVELVRADAARLPFDDREFEAVVSIFSHTDVDDFPAVVREAARVLRAGGTFVYVGLHPCFVGPHSFQHDKVVPTLHPGYRQAGRYTEAPGLFPDGVWAKVSGFHRPLADVIQAVLDAPLSLERFEEDGDEDYPRRIALRARRVRPGST
jgi:SAM-dependent methyltransferase